MSSKRLLPALLLLGAVLTTTACGSGRDALVVYSGRTQNLVEPVLTQFHEETGIAIDVRYGDTADLALTLVQEGDATSADVFLAQSPGAVEYVDSQGLLAPIDDAVLDRVPASFRDDEGHWVGVTGRQRVLVYNTELVDEAELPDSVFDLTDEAYRGRFAVAPPNGSFQDFVAAMRAVHGDDVTRAWLEGIADNGARTYQNNNAIVDAVSRGEVEMGLVNHYYNHRFLAEDPSLPSRNHRFAEDDIGSLVIVSSVSMLAGSDKPEQAQQLIEFLLSEQAQQYFRDETFEYPLAGGLDADPELPPLEHSPEVDMSRLGDDLSATLQMIQDSGLGN